MKLLFTAAALLPFAPLASAAELYEGARLIVDTRLAPMENAAFLVDKGHIVKIGKKGEMKLPAGATRIDLTGKTVMPALLDSHVHLGYQKGLSYLAANFTRENVVEQLKVYERSGIAAVLSLGTEVGDLAFQLRAEQASGKLGGALLRTAGRGFSAPNAGPGNPEMKAAAYGVTNETEARQFVRNELARKADVIKIWVDDRNGTVQKLAPPLYRAIIDEAHKHGARTIAHVYYLDDAKELLRAGIDAFAHIVRDREMDDEVIALLKQRNALVMPNLGIAANRAEVTQGAWLEDPLLRETTPPEVIARIRGSYATRTAASVAPAQQTYRTMERNLAKLNAAGVRIGFGGDAGAVPDHVYAYSAHRELQLMVAAGMTPAQALTSITATAAEFMGLRDLGTLAPGKTASFLVLNGNPLENIANTQKLAQVYMRGQAVRR